MSADNKFIKAGYGTATNLSAPGYTAGVSTTINVASTATWPTTTDVIFAIDEAEVVDGVEQRVDGTYNVFQGTVDTATSIIDVDYIGGDAERSYSAGALTRVYILSSSYLHNRTIDGILESHAQDGTIDAQSDANFQEHIDVVDGKAIRDGNDNELIKFSQTASAVNEVTVKNAATGNGPEVQATGGDTNIDLNLTPKGTGKVKIGGNPIEAGAWASWTPSWTNFTPGSATISARYTQIGKTVHFRIQVTLNGSTMGSDPQFSLPVTASSNEHIDRTLGLAHLKDASPAADNVGVVYLNSTTTAGIFRQIVSGSSIVYSAVTSTAPWTWANNDVIYLRGSYEAA